VILIWQIPLVQSYVMVVTRTVFNLIAFGFGF